MSAKAKQQSVQLEGEEAKSSSYHLKGIVNERSQKSSAVHRDLVFIRRQARENLQKHIDERIPEENEKCIAGMNRFEDDIAYCEYSSDPSTKLQALSI